MRIGLFFIALMSLSFSALPSTVTVTAKQGVTVVSALKQGDKWRNAQVVGILKNGETRKVIGGIGDYATIKVLSSKNKEAVGKVAVAWMGGILSDGTIGGEKAPQGLSLLKENPNTGKDGSVTGLKVGFLFTGDKVEIQDIFYTWFEIERTEKDDWKTGSVCAAYVK